MFNTFTSFYFLVFFLLLLIIYYVFPRKMQWLFLLLFSVAFYLLSGNGLLILYPAITCIVAYLGAMGIKKASNPKTKRLSFWGTILAIVGVLFVLKYINFGVNTINGVGSWFGNGSILGNVEILTPLGISFYSFTILSYVIDVYNQLAEPEKNPLKVLLYGMYFPNILSGPILRYREDAMTFFTPHLFSYKNLTYGLQRMLWGFFKTLVVSERLARVANTIYVSPNEYEGIYIWVGTICFAFQLYANFSGCMDIVLGMSETLGITLPENFNLPFLSKTVAEYWRKWHITLGVWMKEYIFFHLKLITFF